MPSGSDSNAPMDLRRAPAWLHGMLALCAIYIGWHLTGPGRSHYEQLCSIGFLTVMSPVAFALMVKAARRPELPAGVRRALAYIAGGIGLMTIGSAIMIYKVLARTATTANSFGLEDAPFLAGYPVSIIGLLYFPRTRNLVAGPWRILVDGAVFVVGAGVPLWLFAIKPAIVAMGLGEAAQIIAYPIMAFVGIITVNALLLSGTPVPSRAAFWTLLGALGLSWVADIIFSLDGAADVIGNGPINWVNIANALSLSLFMIAAWRFQAEPVSPRLAGRPAAVSPVPLITIVAVAAWSALVLVMGRPDAGMSERMVLSLVLLLVLLLIRETLVVREGIKFAAAEAQRESRARFEAMVRHSSDVIMVVDEMRRVVFASPATALALGLPPEKLLGRDLIDFAHPDDRERGMQFFVELMQRSDKESSHSVQWRLRHADRSYRHFETAGSNLLEEPSVGGLVLNSRDVTERMLLEDQLHQAQKMEAVGRLAGGVAHDFNNLLAVVLANSELALLGLPENHPVRADLEEIKRASTRGSALTGRLLSFGRRQNLQPQVVSPARLLQDTLPFLRRTLGDAVKLSTHVAAETGCIRADPRDVEQALMNLATNARDALPRTGGTLAISLRAETLAKPLVSEYLTAQPGRYVVLAVVDNGAGMDENTRTRLFEPFFSTKERSRGAGLGLAAVFGMVKTAGGGIVVRSAPGQGTAIELWLPEQACVIEEKAAVPAAAPADRKARKILLVEDEDGVRRATQRMLEARGYTVLAASDAREARSVFEQPAARDIDLLLTDVIMPGQSGPVLAADLVRNRPQLRVLFMSGYTGDELKTDEMARTGGQLLVKPFSAEDLTARVRQVLEAPAARG